MIKMNEEEKIKEMLFKLKRQNTYEDIGYFKTPLSNEDVDLFLNYIEQLQQENQQLKEVIEEVREYATNEMRIVNDNEYHKLIQILDKGVKDE